MTTIITELDARREEYPHVRAAFINAIAEEGTKDEAVRFLQRQWNENCALREQIVKMREAWPRIREHLYHYNCRFTEHDTGRQERERDMKVIDAALTSTAQAVTQEGK